MCAAAPAAHADRTGQASTIFSDHCIRCHSAESLRAKVAEASKATKSRDDRLSIWLKDPRQLDPTTRCESARLDAVQRPLVAAFLSHAPDVPVAPKVPPARHGGIAPAPERPGPRLGQGDHR